MPVYLHVLAGDNDGETIVHVISSKHKHTGKIIYAYLRSSTYSFFKIEPYLCRN